MALPAAGTQTWSNSAANVGEDLATSACEVFGEAAEAPICPNFRVALLRPTRALTFFDLTEPGSALQIGALPALSDGPLPRTLTQAWTRAIYEDHPLGVPADGIHYRSAYNGGRSLAVWNAEAKIHVDPVAGADLTLDHPRMLAKLKVELELRHIVIRTITADQCERGLSSFRCN